MWEILMGVSQENLYNIQDAKIITYDATYIIFLVDKWYTSSLV